MLRIIRLIPSIQLLLLLALGLYTLFRLPVWNPIDEGAHFDYIQTIARDHRLPLIFDDSSPVFRAISFHSYPMASTSNPIKLGLGLYHYEAFQPPLYYFLASPFYLPFSSHLSKITLLRFFSFCLYFFTVLVTLKLSRSLLPNQPLASILVLNLFLLPSVLIRNSLITNASLEILLAVLLIYVSYRLTHSFSYYLLLTLSVLTALGILTKFTFIFLSPLFLFFLFRYLSHRRLTLRQLIACLLILALLITPWLTFNYFHYHTLTPNSLALKQQQPFVNPTLQSNTLASLPRLMLATFSTIVIPEEWQHHLTSNRSALLVTLLVVALVFILPLGFIFRQKKYYLFFLPLLLVWASQLISSIIYNWPLYLGRYLFITFPAWSVYLALTYHYCLPPKFRVFLTCILTASVAFSWFLIFHWYYLNPLFVRYY